MFNYLFNFLQVGTKKRRSMDNWKIESKLSEPHIGKKYKREVFGNILPFSQAKEVSKYRVTDRFGLFVVNTDSISNAEQYLAVSALENSTFYFNYIQHTSTQQPIIIFIVTLTAFVFISLVVIAIVKFIQFIRHQYHITVMRRQQRRRAYRPLRSIVLYLHPKQDSIIEDVVKHTKTSARTDKIYYIDGIEQQKKKVKKKCAVSDINIWPVTMQPTENLDAEIYSVIVQGPSSKNNRYILCAGIALIQSNSVTDTAESSTTKRSNKEAQISLQEVHGSEEMTSEL